MYQITGVFCCAKVDAEQQIAKVAVPGQIIFWAVSWRNLAVLAFLAHLNVCTFTRY